MKFAYSVVFLVFAFTLSIFSSDTYAAVPPAGWPNFYNSVKVDLDQFGASGFTISATYDGSGPFEFTLNEGDEPVPVYNGLFELKANFNSATAFVSGTVKIEGTFWDPRLPGPLAGNRFNLFSADLVEADASQFRSSNPNPTIGFRSLFSSFDGWAAQFASADESVYLTLNNALPDEILSVYAGMFDGSASTVTTVPLPPAVWLLMSAFASLSVIGRRRTTDLSA